jgi:D-alanyl-D-alanine carboxypeptidase
MEHVAQDPARSWTPLDLLHEAIQAGSPYFAPGQGMNYSDTGYVLLAMVIEAVTGLTLAQAYREHLLAPLGLASTWLEGLEAARVSSVSHAWAGSIDTAGFNPSFDTFGGGGLVSTAADLDRFITRLLGGGVFRNIDTLLYMMEGTDAAPASGTRKTRTAAGLSAFVVADHLFWGHLGHWNSFMLHSMESDISICGTFNQSEPDPRQMSILETAAAAALEG